MRKWYQGSGGSPGKEVFQENGSSTKEAVDDDTLPILPDQVTPCFPERYKLALLAFLGFVNVYCLRVNLSVAMVAMTTSNSSSDNTTSECPDPNQDANSTDSTPTGEFGWSEATQGHILGSFFYGYIVTQLPGGWLASKIGGKKVFGYGIMCTAILTLVTPIAARTSVGAFILVRVLEGLGEGVTFPAIFAMSGHWAPVMERSKFVAFVYAGTQLGTVIAFPVSGILCDSDFLGGWPSVFYVFGAAGCVWFVAWMLLTYDTPAQHPKISQAERLYIETSIGHQPKVSTPWKAILSSPALWALCVAHFSNNWGIYTLLTSMPSYMKNILHFNVKENGMLSALPYFVSWIMQNVSGVMADALRKRGILSTRDVRKLFTSLGLLLPAVFLILVGYVGCDHISAVAFLTLSVACAGFVMGGFNTNHLDLSPVFGSVLMGITNSFATIPGFASPALVGVLTDHNNTRAQWQIVFYVAGVVYVLGTFVYVILGRGEEQSWSRGLDVTLTVDEEKPINQTTAQLLHLQQ